MEKEGVVAKLLRCWRRRGSAHSRNRLCAKNQCSLRGRSYIPFKLWRGYPSQPDTLRAAPVRVLGALSCRSLSVESLGFWR